MSTISHQNTFSQKSWLLVVSKVELSIICKDNMNVSLKNTLIVKTAIWPKVEAFLRCCNLKRGKPKFCRCAFLIVIYTCAKH